MALFRFISLVPTANIVHGYVHALPDVSLSQSYLVCLRLDTYATFHLSSDVGTQIVKAENLMTEYTCRQLPSLRYFTNPNSAVIFMN